MKPIYGKLNGDIIKTVMLDSVYCAMKEIKDSADSFTIKTKIAKGGDDAEVFTEIDQRVQKFYVEYLLRHFPDFGIIGEEDKLTIKSKTLDSDLWFSIDPIDGTSAFVRKQSHAICTMLALVRNEDIIASYIGNPLTGEVFGYGPTDRAVHRYRNRYENPELLSGCSSPMNKTYFLLRDIPTAHSQRVQKIAESGLFRGIRVDGGSIGTHLARAWTGEISALVLCEEVVASWDEMPIRGINSKLGYVYLDMAKPYLEMVVTDQYKSFKGVIEDGRELLIVHRNYMDQVRPILQRWEHGKH